LLLLSCRCHLRLLGPAVSATHKPAAVEPATGANALIGNAAAEENIDDLGDTSTAVAAAARTPAAPEPGEELGLIWRVASAAYFFKEC
jgi:hypothetical protein